MTSKKHLILFASSLLLLTSCGTTVSSNSSTPVASSSSLTPTSESSSAQASSSQQATVSTEVSSSVSVPSSASSEVTLTTIANVRSGSVGSSYSIKGIVVCMNYTGQTTPYITGFWIADATDSIYVYGQEVSAKVAKGNEVTLTGTKDYYIPTNDTNAATSANYKGMLQLKDPILLSNDGETTHTIPHIATAITVEELSQKALTEDISGKLFVVNGRYSVSTNSAFSNYTITDLNRVDSLLAYTQSNGKDYAWTNDYDGKAVEMTLIISLAKPAVNAWRFCPVSFDQEITVTAQEEAQYGVIRAENQFAQSYDVDTTVTLPEEDPLLTGLIRTFTSTSSQVSITEASGTYTIAIKATPIGTASIAISCAYQTATATGAADFSLVAPTHFETISLAEARKAADGTSVTVEAVVARVTYKSSMTKQGLFLADGTGSLFAYSGDDTLANVADGNKVVVTGTMAHYIKNAENATAASYTGDLQITNFTVKNIDTNVYAIPSGAVIADQTIKGIMSTLPATNLTSNIYRLKAKIVKTAGTYPSFAVADYDDNSVTLPLYSQNSAADFTWLDGYDGKNVTLVVGIQNLNLRASNSNWRGCPLAIESVIA